METLLRDIRFGIRSLLKRPAITAIAIITLAHGIGANTAIFSFVNGILLRPLPYPEPDRLALLKETAFKRGVTEMSISFPNFLDWRYSGVESDKGRSTGGTALRIGISNFGFCLIDRLGKKAGSTSAN